MKKATRLDLSSFGGIPEHGSSQFPTGDLSSSAVRPLSRQRWTFGLVDARAVEPYTASLTKYTTGHYP